MAVTLTDEQAKNAAASLRASAASQLATADMLDPLTTPPTTEPGAGGTVVTPGAFPGRSSPGSEYRQTPVFEDNFSNIVPEGIPHSVFTLGRVPELLPCDEQAGLL